VPVNSVEKLFDIFLGRRIRSYDKTKSNAEGLAKTIAALGEVERGLIFTNLVDFDSLYLPLLMYSPSISSGKALGIRESLADLGRTVADNFGVTLPEGRSLLPELQSD